LWDLTTRSSVSQRTVSIVTTTPPWQPSTDIPVRAMRRH